MLITKKTKTKDLIPFLNEERFKMVLDSMEEYPLDKPLVEMTIGEFIEALEDGYAMRFLDEKYAYKAFGKLKSFKNQMEGINKFFEMNDVEPSADHKKASIGINFLTFEENMLYKTAEFFHLKNFDEAENVKLSNYLLIYKKESSEAKFQHQWNKIIEMKNKMKNGKRR